MKKTRKLLTLFLTCILLLSFTSFPVFATDGTLVYGYDDFQVVIDEVNEQYGTDFALAEPFVPSANNGTPEELRTRLTGIAIRNAIAKQESEQLIRQQRRSVLGHENLIPNVSHGTKAANLNIRTTTLSKNTVNIRVTANFDYYCTTYGQPRFLDVYNVSSYCTSYNVDFTQSRHVYSLADGSRTACIRVYGTISDYQEGPAITYSADFYVEFYYNQLPPAAF